MVPPAARSSLDPDRIVETVRALRGRIESDFPASGLGSQCDKLLDIAEHAREQSEWISKPILWLRVTTAILVGGLLSLVAFVMVGLLTSPAVREAVGGIPEDSGVFFEAVQAVDAGVNELVLLSIVLFFFASIERRVKRDRALRVIHELRSMAHIIDMHQLTKDPITVAQGDALDPDEGPLDESDLARYLDHCTDMLSLTGKIAALYVQDFHDAVALSAVNEIELLTTSLSRKIWQKLSMLQTRPGANGAA
jgi:hypothetical protein